MGNTFYAAITRSKNKNREFKVTKQQWIHVCKQPCTYCGIKSSSSVSTNGPMNVNGVDRLSSQGGYTLGNIVSCCKHCNQMKMDLPADRFLKHVKRIFNYASSPVKPVKEKKSHGPKTQKR
jgi:hypothetical protein